MMSDLHKTIEQLEDVIFHISEGATPLMIECVKLRRQRLESLTVENIRMLLGQNIGLIHLLPLAVKMLHSDPFLEGDFYEGDLLVNVLSSDANVWADLPQCKVQVVEIILKVEKQLPEKDMHMAKAITAAIANFKAKVLFE